MVIKETENDDLTNVMQELIETYADQMGEVAVGLCQELVGGGYDSIGARNMAGHFVLP